MFVSATECLKEGRNYSSLAASKADRMEQRLGGAI